MYIQTTAHPAAQNASPSTSEVSFGSLSQKRPMHPMRLSQYELGALLHALPTAMLETFASAYDLPAEAAPLVHKRTQAAPWTRTQIGKIQFFVKWCLTTTSSFDKHHGQPALQHFLAACIETAYFVPCRRKAPFAHEVLDVGARIGELRQRDIVNLVRTICAAQLKSADASTQPTPQMPQVPSPPGTAQPAFVLPTLASAIVPPLALPPVSSARTHACLTKLQQALEAPGGTSAFAGHFDAHTALKESVAQLNNDFKVWFQAQDAAVLDCQTGLRAQEEAIVQLELRLQEASEAAAYDMWKCDIVLQTLDETRGVLRQC